MASSDATDERKEREVLPKDVVPTLYTLSLTPDLVSHFRFFGRVSINLDVKKDCTAISLNATDLTFLNVSLKTKTDMLKKTKAAAAAADSDSSEDGFETFKLALSTLNIDEAKEIVTIPLPEGITLKKGGKVELNIEYVGVLNDKMKGFYRSRYVRKDGKEAFCGVTQFEATDARRAFPCWDEPAVKSQFAVSMTVPADLQCISNMPETKVTLHGSALKTVEFDTSPIMSTYLLAWFVGEFGFVECKTERGVTVRVWTQVGKEKTGEFACDTAARCLDFYEKYFEIEYPLPKCDMVAVPDFSAGAMENWGLITYREIALLADKETASVKSLRYIAIVVCHELAHQWFGNLVTMDWWSQLWLNEGFACFMEYLSAAALFPDWKLMQLFASSEVSRAFELDAMSTSHPIEVDVKSAEEAEQMFDAISYCKGASVIQMLQAFVGDEVFRKALSSYLSNFRYGNAVTTDLWAYISKESGRDISAVMSNWTREQGFPCVSAEFSAKDNKLTVSQMRHLSSGKLTKAQMDVVWQIPLILRTNNGVKKVLLTEKKQSFDLDADTQWVHLNADSKGFYASSYAPEMMEALLKADALSALNTLEKMCLVRDGSALAEACASTHATENLLNLIAAMKDGRSYPLWDAILSAAGGVYHIIDTDEATKKNFDTAMQSILAGVWSTIGWDAAKDEDTEIGSLLRPAIIGALSKYGDEAVIKTATAKFDAFMAADEAARTPALLDPSLRSTVYAIAVKYGGKKEFDTLRDYYRKATDPSEKSWALRSLAYTRTPATISDLLAWCLNSEEVRSQDKVFPIRVVGSSIAGRELAWSFLQKNFDELYKMLGGGFLVQHLVKVPSSFVSLKKANDVEKFYSTVDKASVQRSIQQCLEAIRTAANWRGESIKVVERWTAEYVKSSSAAS